MVAVRVMLAVLEMVALRVVVAVLTMVASPADNFW